MATKTIQIRVGAEAAERFEAASEEDQLLELAVSGQANFIITGDDDLLVLNPFENISILTPDNWLKNK